MGLIEQLELKQRKIAMAIQLLREAGVTDKDLTVDLMGSASTEGAPRRSRGGGNRTGSTLTPESRAKIGEKMKQRWAEKKAQGKLMNPNQSPKNPIAVVSAQS